MLPTRDGVREVETCLKAYAERLAAVLPVRAIAVIGSRARNDHWRDSDIDLVVVSDAFQDVARGRRIDLLLSPWDGEFALEPFGFTADELVRAETVYLWEALADGRTIFDDGAWLAARAAFQRSLDNGDLQRTATGWRERVEQPEPQR